MTASPRLIPKMAMFRMDREMLLPVILAEDQLSGYEDLRIHEKMIYFMRLEVNI